jgi:hypothetical protein
MQLLKHILVGIVLPIGMLTATIWWRVASEPNMPIFSFEWWSWYAIVVAISALMGAGMHRYWSRH